jgi:hypothetical protein
VFPRFGRGDPYRVEPKLQRPRFDPFRKRDSCRVQAA